MISGRINSVDVVVVVVVIAIVVIIIITCEEHNTELQVRFNVVANIALEQKYKF